MFYLFFYFNSDPATLLTCFIFSPSGIIYTCWFTFWYLHGSLLKKKAGHCLTNYWNTGAFLRSSTWIVTWVMTEEQSWVNVHLSATLFASGSLLHGWMTAAGGFCHNCDWCICLERGWKTVDLLGMHEGRKKICVWGGGTNYHAERASLHLSCVWITWCVWLFFIFQVSVELFHLAVALLLFFSVSHSDLVVVIIDITMMILDVSSKPISPAGNPRIVYSCNDFLTWLGAHLFANKYPSHTGDTGQC